MRTSSFGLTLLAALLLTAPAFAQPATSGAGSSWDSAYPYTAYASTDLNLREAPSASARLLLTIPAGATVQRRECAGGWCPAKYGDVEGFVSERYVSSSRVARQAPSPSSSARSGSSSGGRLASAVQCSGTTKKGARCRRMTRSANGRCYQHGG